MIEALTDPLIISVFSAALMLLCVGLIALKQENKKKPK